MTLSTDAGTQGTREPKLSKRSEERQRAVGWDGGKLLAVGRAALPRWRVRGRGKMKSERAAGGRKTDADSLSFFAHLSRCANTHTAHTDSIAQHTVRGQPAPLFGASRCADWHASASHRIDEAKGKRGGGAAARDTESNRGARVTNAAAQTTRPRVATSERVEMNCELESFVYCCLLRLDCITLRVSIPISNKHH